MTSTAKEVVIPELTLKSESPVEVGYESGEFTVELSLKNVEDISKLDAVAQDSWVSFTSPATAGTEAETAVMKFTYDANANVDARETEVTISYPDADPVTVKVHQAGKPATSIVITSEKNISVEYTEGTFKVELQTSSNVEADGIVAETSDSWVKYVGTDLGFGGAAVMNFSYTANDATSAREATVTVKYDGVSYGTVTISQNGTPEVAGDPLITKALYMKGHCAGYAGGQSWANPDVMKFGNTISVEMLVKHDAEFEETVNSNGNGIGSMFGIERRLLIRHGDNTNNYQEWEVVYVLNEKTSSWSDEYVEAKVKSSVNLPADKWVHIAVVLDGDNKTVTLYQDGEVVGSEAMNPDIRAIDLNETYKSNNTNQQFYLGRAYSNNRDFCGLMSEVRIWNRALTSEEINSKDHFYTVDPDSEGLVAYWKLNEGTGTTLKDYTANGNNLDSKEYNGYVWQVAADWRDVSLPE